MGCRCRSGSRVATASGKKLLGYRVVYPDGSESGLMVTKLEADRAVLKAGGGTVKAVYSQ